MASLTSALTFDEKVITLLTTIANAIPSKQLYIFDHLITIYEDRLELGCKCLLENYDTITKLIYNINVDDYKIEVVPLKNDLLSLTLTKPDITTMILAIVVKYQNNLQKLLYLLDFYKDHLLRYLKTKKISGCVQPDKADSPKLDLSPELCKTITPSGQCTNPAGAWGLCEDCNKRGINECKCGSLLDETGRCHVCFFSQTPATPEVPKLKHFVDLTHDTIDQLIAYTKANPLEDVILTFNSAYEDSSLSEGPFISGSKALRDLIRKLRDCPKKSESLVGKGPLMKEDFVPTDTDIFFLNAEKNQRVKIGDVDLINTKAKTIDEVLLAFDFPCCRVAIDSNGNYKVSIQCLAAIYTGIFYMPEYCYRREKLKEIYNKNLVGCTHLDITALIVKINERYNKYIKRGFKAEYIKTDKVMNFIKNSELFNQ